MASILADRVQAGAPRVHDAPPHFMAQLLDEFLGSLNITQKTGAEFPLNIDYTKFRSATPAQQVQILVASILRSVDLFPAMKVKGFDVSCFRCDFMAPAAAAEIVPPD